MEIWYFLQMFWKDGFSKKKLHWNTIFLVVLSRKMKNFLLPDNITLFFRRKMKDDLSQKNTWKYDIFFKCLKKMVFLKIIALEYDLSIIIWKDDIFFSGKYDISFSRKYHSLNGIWKMVFLKKEHWNIFSLNAPKRWSF